MPYGASCCLCCSGRSCTTLGSESSGLRFTRSRTLCRGANFSKARTPRPLLLMPIWWIGMLGMSTMGLIPLASGPSGTIPGVIGIGLLHPYYKPSKGRLWKRLSQSAKIYQMQIHRSGSGSRLRMSLLPGKIPASDAIIQHNLTLIERMRQRVAGGKEVETLAYETLSVQKDCCSGSNIKVDPDTLRTKNGRRLQNSTERP